ncbi:hypothetical protein GCM10011610_42800 [Nocardia rhizosphaerihabitans]|uniref:Uncharacterized protein n=1 Tax=Nocardia rhizosphaerihabitans TaxID=1691570 RepID=A0ABQ2KM04_9NOCA|nr:hypothetical protein GCM10011610_42800 [Nocardia rhizosphaerihabitans]
MCGGMAVGEVVDVGAAVGVSAVTASLFEQPAATASSKAAAICPIRAVRRLMRSTVPCRTDIRMTWMRSLEATTAKI